MQRKKQLQSSKPIETLIRVKEYQDRLVVTSPQLVNNNDPQHSKNFLFSRKNLDPIERSKKKIQNSDKQTRGQEAPSEVLQKNKQLSQQITLFKQKVNRTQNQIIQNKQRFQLRRQQYIKHIEQLQRELRIKSSISNTDNNLQERKKELQQLHSRIGNNIGLIQKNTSKILIQQESQIIHYFNKKIQQIKQKFKKERVDKGEKDQQFIEKEKKLMKDLQQIKSIAHKIDSQNHNLMKKYIDLKTQYDIQHNDRDNLFKQLILKKKKHAILKAKHQQYQLLLKEADQQQQSLPPEQTQPKIQPPKKNQRAARALQKLKCTLKKQQKQLGQLKREFVLQVKGKSQLQKSVREQVQRVGGQRSDLSREERALLIASLLSNKQVMGLLEQEQFAREIQA